jgi:hypothetical protein
LAFADHEELCAWCERLDEDFNRRWVLQMCGVGGLAVGTRRGAIE